jgi:Holliday junction resolvasome RuvABC DNA-binding subunit
MSCYFRHMADVFAEAGIDLDEVKADKARKKEVDAKIHALVGIGYKDCPQAWKKVKEMLADDKGRAKLVKALKS